MIKGVKLYILLCIILDVFLLSLSNYNGVYGAWAFALIMFQIAFSGACIMVIEKLFLYKVNDTGVLTETNEDISNEITFNNYFSNDVKNPYMKGEEFEYCIANLLNKLGYQEVKIVSLLGTISKYKGDGGVDITAIDKNNRKVAIQCKNTRMVSNDIITRTHGAKDLKKYKCDYAMVVTSGNFTLPATKEASELGVVLWNGKKVQTLLKQTETIEKKEKRELEMKNAYGTVSMYDNTQGETDSLNKLNLQKFPFEPFEKHSAENEEIEWGIGDKASHRK